jgi:hypothetical protein
MGQSDKNGASTPAFILPYTCLEELKKNMKKKLSVSKQS